MFCDIFLLILSKMKWVSRELEELTICALESETTECNVNAYQKKSKGPRMRPEWLVWKQSRELHRERAVLLRQDTIA